MRDTDDPTRSEPAPEPDERMSAHGDADAGDGVVDEGVVRFEFTDVLDLHGFQPRDLPAILDDYLDAAWEAGWTALRIVHGRGIGVQRERVRARLARDPRVAGWSDAPGGAGGWGATIVTLKPR